MRTSRLIPTLLGLGLLAAAAAARAQPGEVPLSQLLAGAGDRLERTFLVDVRVPDSVVVGAADPADLDYAGLLGVLRNNGLAAVEIDGYSNIVRVEEIRQHALPIVDARASGVADDEWVTRVIDVEGDLEAAMLVPVLRPLLPQYAHLSAIGSANKLVVVDRFANVRRIEAIIDAMR